MKILQVSVHGFGKFSQKTFTFSPTGLQLILGPNEAGKSTLFRAIARLLFGYQPREPKKHDQPWQNHTKFGGELHLALPQGKLIIQRNFSKNLLQATLKNQNQTYTICSNHHRPNTKTLSQANHKLWNYLKIKDPIALFQALFVCQMPMEKLAPSQRGMPLQLTLFESLAQLFPKDEILEKIRSDYYKLTSQPLQGERKTKRSPGELDLLYQKLQHKQQLHQQNLQKIQTLNSTYQQREKLQKELHQLQKQIHQLQEKQKDFETFFHLQAQLKPLEELLQKTSQNLEQLRVSKAKLELLQEKLQKDFSLYLQTPPHFEKELNSLLEEEKTLQNLQNERKQLQQKIQLQQTHLQNIEEKFHHLLSYPLTSSLPNQLQHLQNKCKQLQQQYKNTLQLFQQLPPSSPDEIQTLASKIQELIQTEQRLQAAQKLQHLLFLPPEDAANITFFHQHHQTLSSHPKTPIPIKIAITTTALLLLTLAWLYAPQPLFWTITGICLLLSLQTLYHLLPLHPNAKIQKKLKQLQQQYPTKMLENPEQWLEAQLLQKQLQQQYPQIQQIPPNTQKFLEKICSPPKKLLQLYHKSSAQSWQEFQQQWSQYQEFEQTYQQLLQQLTQLANQEVQKEQILLQTLQEQHQQHDQLYQQKQKHWQKKLSTLSPFLSQPSLPQEKKHWQEFQQIQQQIQQIQQQIQHHPTLHKDHSRYQRQWQRLQNRLEDLAQKYPHLQNILLEKLPTSIPNPPHLSHELQTLQEQYQQLQKEMHQLNATLQLESEHFLEPALLEEEIQHLQQEIQQKEIDKQALELAYLTLQEESAKYFQNLLPNIEKNIQNILQQIQWPRIQKVQLHGENLHLYLPEKNKVPPTSLSQGTSDLLYLLLRLALLDSITSHSPFPFLMDEALIYLDKDRQAKAFSLLQTLSSERQILYFTCDESLKGYATSTLHLGPKD